MCVADCLKATVLAIVLSGLLYGTADTSPVSHDD